jgi:hypothetical protein
MGPLRLTHPTMERLAGLIGGFGDAPGDAKGMKENRSLAEAQRRGENQEPDLSQRREDAKKKNYYWSFFWRLCAFARGSFLSWVCL